MSDINLFSCRVIEKYLIGNGWGSGKRVSIMLTGGATAYKIYKKCYERSFINVVNIDFYFGDERCVPPEHKDSNYKMAVKALFHDVIPENITVHRMKGESIDLEREAVRYSGLLPDSIDILLFSMGLDGHIASIFPNSDAVEEKSKNMVVTYQSPKAPSARLTITRKVILSAKKIIIFAAGEEKGKILAKAFKDFDNVSEFPVRLAFSEKTAWLLDSSAASQLDDPLPRELYGEVVVCS